jgi:hypothetical protein
VLRSSRGWRVIAIKETNMRKHSIGYLFAMLAVAACGTDVEIDSTSAVGSGNGSNPDLDPDPLKVCPEPEGPRHDFTTLDEATQLIIGTWIHCTGPTPTPLQGSSGVEIAADGKYYALVSDGHGGLVRGTGFSSQGTWDMKGEGSVFLELWPTPSSEVLDTPLFEDNPRRFAFDQTHAGNFAIYQAITP